MEEEKGKTDESIHPSIRRWKDPPTVTQGTEVQGENENDLNNGYPTMQAEIDARRRRFENDLNNGYPTTQAEIDARRRRLALPCVAIVYLLFLVMFSLVYIPVVLFISISGCCASASRSEQDE
jgi:hypothetical protein